MLNVDLKKFTINHKKNINQVIYYSAKTNGIKEINNLINNFLNEKNSFVFESVEKGVIKGRYTIFIIKFPYFVRILSKYRISSFYKTFLN